MHSYTLHILDTFSQHEHNSLMADGDDGMELGEQVELESGSQYGTWSPKIDPSSA